MEVNGKTINFKLFDGVYTGTCAKFFVVFSKLITFKF